MPNAVTHMLVAMVLVDVVRHHLLKTHHIKRWQFSTTWIFFVGFAALLPDVDLLIQWSTYWLTGTAWMYHGALHQLYIPFVAFVLAVVFYYRKQKVFGYKHRSIALFFLLLGIGFFTHILLDCAVLGGYPLLPPFLGNGVCTKIIGDDPAAMPALDAFLFVLWLFYEQKRHKIRDII